MTSTALRTILRAALAGLFLGGMMLVAALGPASAQAGREDQDPAAFTDDQGNFDIDAYIAASTGAEDGCSPASAAVGDTITCTVHGYASGETVTATLHSDPVVVFEGPSTGTTFTFSWVVPDVDAAQHELDVCGTDTGGDSLCRSFALEVVGNEVSGGTSALARTGSNNTGTLVGVGAALVVLGGAALFGARRRFSSTAA